MGRHALLIGTAAHHADDRLHALPSVRHDIDQVKAVLDSQGEFDSVERHLDLHAGELRRVTEEFYGVRRDQDFALLYYSGHGVLHADRQSLFLAASDTHMDQLHTTAFDIDGILRHLLNATKASQKVVLLDCCFSGSFTARHRFRGGVREEPRRTKRERGTFVLTSSTHVKASKIQGSDRPSVFTEVILEGLRGAAQSANHDGWITSNDLSRFTLAEMARRGHHTPVESSEGVTEPIKLVTTSDGVIPNNVPRVPNRTPTAADDAVFDGDQWRRLLTYYTSCLQRSNVLQSFVDPQKDHLFITARQGREAIFTATAPVPLSDRVRRLADQARAGGKTLQYGYPIVALQRGRPRRTLLAPLLVCDVSVGDDNVLHPHPLRPNPALVDHFELSAVEADELAQEVARTFTPGDPKVLAAAAELLMATFDIKPAHAIDPEGLLGTVRTTPVDRVQNAAVLYVAGTTGTPEGALVDDLRDIAKKPDLIRTTALGALAKRAPHREPTDTVSVALGPVSESQEDIIRSAMTQTLTVAQGPPGTGKSQLVTALLTTATAVGQSVLIGSTNNRAVDEVVDRIAGSVGSGLIVRTGNKEYRQREPEQLAAALSRYPKAPRGKAADAETPLHELRMLSAALADLRKVLDEHRLLERDLADLAIERIAPECATTGPVLPDDDLALAQLVALTDRAQASRWFGWWYRWRLRRFGVSDTGTIAALGERATFELRWRERRERLESLTDAQEAWRRSTTLLRETRPALSEQLLQAQIAHRISTGAQLLRDRADEMAKPDGKSWAFFPQLLQVLPGWATTALSARRLPLKDGMYDLVIIDEAAQCTVPAVLPMLYRARRALIIGDPRQLAPVVDLPEDEDERERARVGLSGHWLTERRLVYRNHSAYEAFAAMAGVTHLLDEHYRCHPDIIDAPNRVVYQGRLTVLTDTSRLAMTTETAVRWVDVRGSYRRGGTGSGRNDIEAAAVVDLVHQLRFAYPDANIGVVTPLAAQQQVLSRGLREAGLQEGLLCATIHRFQGSERDIMVASPVGAHGVSEQTRSWLIGQTNLWNVALTRAKAQLIVVGDQSWWSAQRGLLTALATGVPAPEVDQDTSVDAVDRLHRALLAAHLGVRRNVTLAGYSVDLMVQEDDHQLAVLVDDPGGDANGRKLRKVLARLDVVRVQTRAHCVPAWRCLAEPDQVAAELSAELLRMKAASIEDGGP